MKTIKTENIKLKKVHRIPNKLKEGVFYWTEEFETAAHLCLCGCKLRTVTPKSMGWEMIDDNGTITLIGSVGNQKHPCKSHYIITKGVAKFV